MPYRPRNSRYYYASLVDARGQRLRRSTGTTDYAAAKALEGQWRADVWRQKHWGERPRYSFETLIEAYLDDNDGAKASERALYAAKALAPWFAGRCVEAITAAEIAAYKRERLAQVAVATVIKELGLFSAAINYANSHWDWGLPNVVAGRIPSPPEGRLRWLAADEAKRLIAAAEAPRAAPYLADFIRLALHTGLRHGELLNLTWPRIDFDQQLIYFAPADHKAGRAATVPLNAAALALLHARFAARATVYRPRRGPIIAAETAPVFTFRGRAVQSAKKSFASACHHAGIEGATIHDLRHTFASRLVQAGVPIATVKDVMRHRSIQTTMRYAHLAPENSRHAVAALAGYDATATPTRPKPPATAQT